MFDLISTPFTSSNPRRERELDLRRALLHPAWIGGVLLLAANDHLLKGSGLLPAAVTGKLSDFAGLFIAPVLAAVFIGLRTRRAWVALHLVVGAVFAALQLSVSFAAAWSQAFAALGLEWTTTMDPTDLTALASLAASWRTWTPIAAKREALAQTLARPWRRGATVGLALGGLTVSAATSQVPEIDEFYPDFSAQTFLHNDSDLTLSVLLRPMRDDVALACGEVALDPGALLPDAAFAGGERWELPAHTSINAWTSWEEHECYAVMVSGDTFAPFIMFWDGDLPHRLVPGQMVGRDGLLPWGVAITSNPDGQVVEIADTGSELSYLPTAAETQPGEGCEMADPDRRLDWVAVPSGSFAIEVVDFGVDNCLRLSMSNPSSGQSYGDGFVCMPFELFPFRDGDLVEVQADQRSLVITDAGVDPAEARHLRLDRGAHNQALSSAHFDMAARTRAACGAQVDLDCVTAERSAELLVVGELGNATLHAGEAPTKLPLSDGRTANLHLAHASSRSVLDAACASGSDLLGVDLDLVTLIQNEA